MYNKGYTLYNGLLQMFIVDIEVACTNYEGVDAVKRALKKGLELSTESMPIKVGFGKCSQNLSRG